MSLKLSLPQLELFDREKEEFKTIGGMEIELEYSLYTISIWESKWKVSYMDKYDKSSDKAKLDLFRCMCITPDVPSSAWSCMTAEHRRQILEYISDPMSATTVHSQNKPGPKKIITTEQLYYWMAELNIPYSCEHWHFNRLMKLIQVGMASGSPGRKMSKAEVMRMNTELNAKRKAALGTRG